MRDLLLELPADERPRVGIEKRLRQLIRDGLVGPGAELPSTRSLAIDLGVARSTVVAAYEQLAVEGYLRTSQGKPSVVADVALPARPKRDENSRGERPRYDFRPGEPEVGSFPRREWLRSTRSVLAEASDDAFGYADPRGLVELRQALANYLARARMVSLDASAVRVYAGFASSLGFVAESFRRKGIKQVAVEQPMLPLHRTIFELVGVETVPVQVDRDGICVDVLVELDVGAVMVTAANQHPLGVTLSSARRQALIEWARSSGSFIIEDDYDGEFRYDRRPIGALQGLDPDRGMYAGTASKSLAPGVGLSWLVVPRELRADLGAVTHLRAGASALNQMVLADLISRGAYDRHVRQQRRTYRSRQAVIVERLADFDWLEVAASNAGMHVVARIVAETVDERDLLDKAQQASVGLIGLRTHYGHDEPGLIINVSRPPSHQFSVACDRLCNLLAGRNLGKSGQVLGA